MTKRILIILIIAGLVMSSCDPEKDIYCPDTDNDGNGHLGTNELCIKTSGGCTGLMDYRTENAKNSSHDDYFPVPIYRVGPISDFPSDILTTTRNHIIAVHKSLDGDDKNGIKNGVSASDVKLSQVHVHKTVNGAYPFTWNKSILGLQSGTLANLDSVFRNIAAGNLPTAQLQPASDIRMANGNKAKSAAVSAAASAVAQNFKLNHHADNIVTNSMSSAKPF